MLLLGLVVAWAAMILRVKTANGTIVLENVPEDAVVEIDGDRITVTPTAGEPLKIEAPAGKHGLVVRRGDLVFLVESVTLEAGKPFKHKLTARLEPPVVEHPGKIDLSPDATQRPDAGPAVKTPSSQDSITNSIGMTLKLIPAGEFMMGSPDNDKDARSEEKPQHRVRISKSFYLGVYEVTQAQYKAVMGNNPSYFSPNGGGKDKVAGQSTDQYPVENVSWLDAITVLQQAQRRRRAGSRSMRSMGKTSGFRTGTGRAIGCRRRRSGNTPAGRTHPRRRALLVRRRCGEAWANMGGSSGNSESTPTRSARKSRTASGCMTCTGTSGSGAGIGIGEGYYKQSREDDPTGPAAGVGLSRVARGGGWTVEPRFARSASRFGREPDARGSLGFRVALGQSGR